MPKTWKQVEKAVGSRLDAERISNQHLGSRVADCQNEWFSIEVKHRKRGTIPQWLWAMVEQCVTNAGERTPILVLHEQYQRHDNDLVVLRLKDFEDLYGQLKIGDEE